MTDNHLLLIEDDEVFAQVTARAMDRRGFKVQHAPDKHTALELVHAMHFDFAILDLNLGGHSSLELIPVLRRKNPDMPILILTGYASIATAVEAIKLGATNYLAKPADAGQILTALLSADEGDKAAHNPAAIPEPMSVRRLEWEHIQKVLQENNGNISETARQLKMHRRTLQRKLQKKPVAR
ncbi:MAG: response regulator transcription factor [Pseudomonadales bacterium]|nr:response regulator transcription factor [Pseudomonadales bacterium]